MARRASHQDGNTAHPADTPSPRRRRYALAHEPNLLPSLLVKGERRVIGAVEGAIEGAAERVERERLPRRRILGRGHVLLLYLVGLALIIALSIAAHSVRLLPGDLPFTRELQETRNPALYGLLYAVSYIGYPVQATVILALTVLALWLTRLRLEALFALATLLGDAVVGILKLVVGRHRPSPSLVAVAQPIASPSFPSGHAAHFLVFYGFLAFVLAVNFRPSWRRNALISVCVALIALVGISRVYLGEHWLSDVVGGYLVGALSLVPLVVAYLWAKARYDPDGRARRRPAARSET